MVTLREAIRATYFQTAAIGKFPNVTAVEDAANRITEGGLDGGFQAGKNYNQVARTIQTKLEAREHLSRRELLDAPWCLWGTEPSLAEENGLLSPLFEQIRTANNPRFIRPLAASYLQNFRKNLPGIAQLGLLISALLATSRSPYRKLSELFQLFDAETGPDIVANSAISSEKSPTRLLEENGANQLIAKGGFASYTGLRALEIICDNDVLPGTDRLALTQTVALNSDGQLRFPESHKAAFANALLIPYQDEHPEKSVRDQTLDLLSRLIGDPRIHPARWGAMPEAEQVALRWYTEQSLRQFLDIVDRVADPQMWLYRRRFWEAVYNRNLIDTAWVVFDESGAHEARRSFGNETRFGKFNTSVEQGQAVILLRIGACVVAEWSHNGRCHIWNDAEYGPRLYHSSYSSHDLRASSSGNLDSQDRFSQSHQPTVGYTWQAKVANRLHKITGIRVHKPEYRVH